MKGNRTTTKKKKIKIWRCVSKNNSSQSISHFCFQLNPECFSASFARFFNFCPNLKFNLFKNKKKKRFLLLRNFLRVYWTWKMRKVGDEKYLEDWRNTFYFWTWKYLLETKYAACGKHWWIINFQTTKAFFFFFFF